MIIVKVIGGLGNQMFQYALGRHLAYINDVELKLDISGFESYEPYPYALNHFNIIENFATPKEIRPFTKYHRKNGRRWFWYNRLIADRSRYADERQFHFEPWILTLKDLVYLDGYWQTEKYFNNIGQIIRRDFIIKEKQGPEYFLTGESISASNAVSVHVRRNELISNPRYNSWHGVCSIEYYTQSGMIMGEKVKDPHFFVFSDDPVWAKENILFDNETTYIDHGSATKNYEDLHLMSMCKHHIIANSSFSWWGAWLNPSMEKIVIAPKKWFAEGARKCDTRDITPNNWIQI